MARPTSVDATDADRTSSREPDGSTGVEIEIGETLILDADGGDADSGGVIAAIVNKQRRRRGVLAVAGAALALGAAACGVGEERFNAASSEAETLKSENRKLERENSRLKKEQVAATAEASSAVLGAHPRAVPRSNVAASFNPEIDVPQISDSTYVDEKASVIGRVILSEGVYVAPSASVRGDEGEPIFVVAGSNIQDGVVLHGLETFETDQGDIMKNQVSANGSMYSV